jgi:hypothetical protein
MPILDAHPVLRASADGRVFAWATAAGFEAVQLSGGKLVSLSEDRDGVEGARRSYSRGGKRPRIAGFGAQLVPALQGPLCLSVPGANNPGYEYAGPVTVHLDGEMCPLLALPDVARRLMPSDGRSSEFLVADERLFLLPAARVLAILPDARNSVVLRRFDIKEELKASGTDDLVVLSSPPSTVRLGGKLSYQIDAWSKAGGVTCRLEAGPQGMTVSGDGLLTWTADRRIGNEKGHVVVVVRDAAGQVVRHAFGLELDDRQPEVDPAGAAAQFRTFHDVTGKYQIEATFVGIADGKVQFKKKDGSTLEVPLEKLAPADQEWLRRK